MFGPHFLGLFSRAAGFSSILLSHQIECWFLVGKIKLLKLKMCVPQ